MLTFLPLEQIDEMAAWEGSELNKAKQILAFELTKMVHGEEEAQKADAAAKALFGGGGNDENMPCTTLEDSDFENGSIDIVNLLVRIGVAKSKGEGRRLIEQNGLSVDDAKVTDPKLSFTQEALKQNAIVVKRGKKIFHKVQA
jgi:tyrosyl-tRNA synthetase